MAMRVGTKAFRESVDAKKKNNNNSVLIAYARLPAPISDTIDEQSQRRSEKGKETASYVCMPSGKKNKKSL